MTAAVDLCTDPDRWVVGIVLFPPLTEAGVCFTVELAGGDGAEEPADGCLRARDLEVIAASLLELDEGVLEDDAELLGFASVDFVAIEALLGVEEEAASAELPASTILELIGKPSGGRRCQPLKLRGLSLGVEVSEVSRNLGTSVLKQSKWDLTEPTHKKNNRNVCAAVTRPVRHVGKSNPEMLHSVMWRCRTKQEEARHAASQLRAY